MEKSRLVADKVAGSDEIRSETDSLAKQWSELEAAMSSRIALLTGLGEKWKNVEEECRKIDVESSRTKDVLANFDPVVRSKTQLVESVSALHVSY